MRGTISGSASQSRATSQVQGSTCSAAFKCNVRNTASHDDTCHQVTSISGSAASSPWSTPTKISPRGEGRRGEGGRGAGGGKEAADALLQHAPSLTTLKALSVALNRDVQLNERPSLHQHQHDEERVLEEQAQLGNGVQDGDLSQQQQDGEQQQLQQLEQLEQKHAAEMLHVTQQHDTALAELQERCAAAEENAVLLNLRTQRLEGTAPPLLLPLDQRISILPLITSQAADRSSWNVRRPRVCSGASGAVQLAARAC